MSTIKVNKIENTSTTDGGISIDNSGHVTIDGQQLPTAGALSNRNLIVNGGMTVSQRSTSETGVSGAGYKTVDRMRYSENSLSNTESTIEQSTDAPDGFANSLKVTVTTAEGSVGATDGFRPLQTRLEGQNLQHLQYGTSSAKSLTLSFYVKSSVTGTYSIAFYRNETTDRLITATYAISSANTWEYKTITIPGDTGASITNDNANRFEVLFHAGAGSDWTSTDSSGSWGDYVSTGFAYGSTVNLQNTLNAIWQATGLQLEVGEKATVFEHRSFSDELRSCQRYYQKSYDYVTAPGATNHEENSQLSIATSTTRLSCFVNYRVEMREDPTEIIYSPSGNSGKYANINSYADAGDASVPNNHAANTGFHQINVTGATAGNHYQFHYTADAEL